MKIRQLLMLLIFCFFSYANVFADDRKFEGGKPVEVDFKNMSGYENELTSEWMWAVPEDHIVFDNINIGAGTDVALKNEWQYVFISSQTGMPGVAPSTYTYRQDEVLATLVLKKDGKLTLNAGSGLSLRNQYNLVTSTKDVSLSYIQTAPDVIVSSSAYFSDTSYLPLDEVNLFAYEGTDFSYFNRELLDDSDDNLFQGDIVFGAGDAETVLKFETVSGNLPDQKENIGHLPLAKEDTSDVIKDISKGRPTSDIAIFDNNFKIDGNKSVFDVEGDASHEVFLSQSIFSGDGTVIKRGGGALILYDLINRPFSVFSVDSTALTGKNTGYAWSIENGAIFARGQESLGYGKIKIESEDSTLALSPTLDTGGVYSNDIEVNNGNILAMEDISLSGNLSGSNLNFILYNSRLNLLGLNNADTMSVYFSNLDNSPDGNYLVVTSTSNLSKEVNAVNKEDNKYANFTLVMDLDNDADYSGSLSGEMYVQKEGTGTLTMSGISNYTQGTYLSNGAIAIANGSALGTGKILFDSVIADSTTYASLKVADAAGDTVDLSNNIHINRGAIFDIQDGKTLSLRGDVIKYGYDYDADFIKTGLGTLEIGAPAAVSNTTRQVNISTFTVNEGGFRLADGVVLNSYFSLGGQDAFLEMMQGSGVTNNIDIANGDLKIFNEFNISSSAVNFLNTSTSSLSMLQISSNTVLSSSTMQHAINISSGINVNVLNDAVAYASTDTLKFLDPANSVIEKTGTGELQFDALSGNFEFSELAVNGGKFTLVSNSTMTVSGSTVVDGGILAFQEGSYYTYALDNSTISVLNGGLEIYDSSNIDSTALLHFVGSSTATADLARLVVTGDNVTLTNDILVEKGVIVENEKNLTISGDEINFASGSAGIFGKAGSGIMTIDSLNPFNMGEIRVLDGLLNVKSDINVSTVSVTNSSLAVSDASMDIAKEFNLFNAGLALSTSSISADMVFVVNSSAAISNSVMNIAKEFDLSDNAKVKVDAASVINAYKTNISSNSVLYGEGTLHSAVNVNSSGAIKMGATENNADIGTLTVGNTTFKSGSSLYVDVDSTGGILTNDKLVVNGDLNIANNVDLNVFVGGADSEYDAKRSFEILAFSGMLNIDPTNISVFNTILSNARLSSSITNRGNSLWLDIFQNWTEYALPGATVNQQAMMDALNGIYGDPESRLLLNSTLNQLDSLYNGYLATGDSSLFTQAMSDLSGIFYANTLTSGVLASKRNMIYTRLVDFSNRGQNGLWAQAYINSSSVDANEGNPEFTNNLSGVIAGYDTYYNDETVLGISGFYGFGNMEQGKDTADITDAGFNAYGFYRYDDFEIKGLFGYGMQNYDAKRKIRFIDREIKSKYTVNTLDFDLEGAYKHYLNQDLILKPLVGVNCSVAMNDDFNENGNMEQKLSVQSNTFAKTELRFGVGLQSDSTSVFNWYCSAVVKQILDGTKPVMTASFSNIPDYEFEIEGTKLDRTSIAANVGCLLNLTENVDAFLDLSADTFSNRNILNTNVGVSYKW